MERMVKITSAIPRAYERVILEEYYKFICSLYGYRRRGNVTYSMDRDRWYYRDEVDRALNVSLEFLSPRDKINFACLYDDEVLKAMARFRTLSSTHIADIIFTDYPNYGEKIEYVKDIIDGISEWMNEQPRDVFPLSVEVPKGDIDLLSIIDTYGFVECDKTNRLYPTSILERKRVLTNDGPTRNRKKA